MKIFGLIGWSASGKTTLLTRLLPLLIGRGLTVSTVKHGHHDLDIDKPGKDSYRHREAGATEVLLMSGRRWALMHELRDEVEPVLDDLIGHLTPVDLLLVEGFKHARHDKIEVHRPALGKPLMGPGDPTVVAVASDGPLAGLDRPLIDLNDPVVVADFIQRHCGLSGPWPTGVQPSPQSSPVVGEGQCGG